MRNMSCREISEYEKLDLKFILSEPSCVPSVSGIYVMEDLECAFFFVWCFFSFLDLVLLGLISLLACSI